MSSNLKECNTLEDVRNAVDELDIQIVDLIASRRAYIKQAAQFKSSVDEVKAPERIEAVIQKIRTQGLMLDVSPNMLEDIYTLMINEMVETEIAEFRNAKDL
jgi:isochorismate pyruvate lyase